MAKIKVYAPNEGYAGTVGAAKFEKGVADVDEDATEMGYFRKAGYGIGSKAEPTVEETVDARDVGQPTPFGSKLRDAAVDPEPSDFLPPTNAGKANPHGPLVVAPGIHAEGPAGIKPGEVHVDDPDEQAKDETALAVAVLVENQPADERAVEMHADENMGPLGLSDPGSVDMGVDAAKDVAAADTGSATMAVPEPKPESQPRKPRGSKK